MPTFAEMAVAAHVAAKAAADAAEAARIVAARTALIAAARTAVAPVLTDAAAKVVFDPKLLKVEWTDVANGIVVFSTPPDSPPTYLWVKGSVVKLTRQDAGAWVTHRADGTQYPELKRLEDVGAVLAAG